MLACLYDFYIHLVYKEEGKINIFENCVIILVYL